MLSKIVALFFSLLCTFSLTAQIDNSEKDLQESYQQAIEEFSKVMDTLDFSKIFEENFSEFFNEFDQKSNPNQDSFQGILDSLNFEELLGGSNLQYFGDTFKSMDSVKMNKLLEESMQLFQQMDLSQFQGLMDQLDLSELHQMFDGMNMEEFNFQYPQQPSDDNAPEKKEDQKLKKI